MLGSLLIMGCEDKAEPRYNECVAFEAKGDVLKASIACEDAIKIDASSKSGKLAAEKLTALQPALEKRKKDADEQRKKDAEIAKAQEQAEATARAERAQALRSKITRKHGGYEPDGTCTGKGLPPYWWEYTGGTFAEDAEVAAADGCSPKGQSRENTDFCCPKGPLKF